MTDWKLRLPASRTPCPFPRLKLTASKHGEVLDTYPLCNADACVVIGRKDCDIILAHPSTSRKHAVVFFEGQKVMLMDLKSPHGTFVDGQQLSAYDPVEIAETSEIRFGGSTRTYRITDKDSPAAGSMGPPVGLPGASRTKAPAKTEEVTKQDRESKLAEIAAITREMTSSNPTWKPQSGKRKPLEQDASILAGEIDLDDAAVVVPEAFARFGGSTVEDDDGDDDDEDDDDDDDDDFGPLPPSAAEVDDEDGDRDGKDEGKTDSYPDMDGGRLPAGEDENADQLDVFALAKKIPVSHSVELTGHNKSVLCLSYEPAGNRVVTGSMDYTVKMYDFGGMDRRHAFFREARPEDGHPVIAVSHSPSGDRFVAAPSSAQPVVYDREASFLIKFVSGDPYIRDQTNTKGHTKTVTGARWHPTERETILTSALDGTLRLWNLGGTTTFKMLISKTCIKTRNARGLVARATCCTYGAGGSTIVGGTEDGTVQIWQEKKAYSRADTVLTPPNLSPIRWVEYSPDGHILASRADNGVVHLWDVRRPAAPLKTFTGMSNIHETANVCFSPDGEMCVVATSPDSRDSGKSSLMWLPVKDASEQPCMKITVSDAPYSAIAVKWHPDLKQIFCTMGSMTSKVDRMGTRVYYDPRFSVKGATRTAGRAPPRPKDASDFAAVGEIITPHALPMFREESALRRKKGKARDDPLKTKKPQQPPQTGPGSAMNTSFFFTQYVMSERQKDRSGEEDPREALLRVAKRAKADPMYLGSAYAKTQPQTQLESKTLEQEQEEREQARKRVIR